MNSSHTFQFDAAAAANEFEQLSAVQKSWAGVLPPGKYPFHCTVDSHAASGMVGTLTAPTVEGCAVNAIVASLGSEVREKSARRSAIR